MASHKKFTNSVALKILRHVERQPKIYKNPDVDLERTGANTVIIDKGKNWYKKRLSQVLYDKKRTDIVTLCGVVVTLPQELNHLSVEEQDKLFKAVTDFLENRYGNGVNATIHRDEKGQPHLHYLFIPIVKNDRTTNERLIRISDYLADNPTANNTQISKALGIPRASVIRWRRKMDKPRVEEYQEKLCAKEVLSPNDLKTFHKNLADYLDRVVGEDVGKLFHSGITKKTGNKSIEQLKSVSKAQNFTIDHSYEFLF